jgi:hypothetical protein
MPKIQPIQKPNPPKQLKTTIQPEKSADTNVINIETKRIFCFNGTFTILTVFILILLLIFVKVNSNKQIS